MDEFQRQRIIIAQRCADGKPVTYYPDLILGPVKKVVVNGKTLKVDLPWIDLPIVSQKSFIAFAKKWLEEQPEEEIIEALL